MVFFIWISIDSKRKEQAIDIYERPFDQIARKKNHDLSTLPINTVPVVTKVIFFSLGRFKKKRRNINHSVKQFNLRKNMWGSGPCSKRASIEWNMESWLFFLFFLGNNHTCILRDISFLGLEYEMNEIQTTNGAKFRRKKSQTVYINE